MKISHKWEYVDGDFDTETGRLSCVGNEKYGSVALCFHESWHIGFAKIKLYSRDRAVDADAVFEDAMKLGEEIARRWNAFAKDKTDKKEERNES
jgi:hypothetical protein